MMVNVNEQMGIVRLEFYSQVPSLPEPITQETPEGVLQRDHQPRELSVRTTCIVPLAVIPNIQRVIGAIPTRERSK